LVPRLNDGLKFAGGKKDGIVGAVKVNVDVKGVGVDCVLQIGQLYIAFAVSVTVDVGSDDVNENVGAACIDGVLQVGQV
jgi:hypothetical protein